MFIFKEIIAVYALISVDNMLFAGLDFEFIKKLVTDLNEQFSLRDLGELSYFLRIEARRNVVGLHICQTKYAPELLRKENMQDCNGVSTPMVMGYELFVGDGPLFDRPTLYGSIIRALQYSTLTMLDISYSVNRLNQFLKELTQMQ